ncbi:MAG: tetratricopeptide repeat protein, partial [Bryobacteraceae bacterium]|nr:tetratricopeptide repeat protein [Bryobacteraceae bacterium]
MLLVAIVLLASAAPLPPAARLPLQRGIEALDKNELEAARTNFEQASKMVPRNASVWLLLAQTYARLKNAPLAAAAALKAETFGSTDSEIVHGLIHFYVETQPDLVRAVKLETACVSRNPKDAGKAAELRTMLGNEYVQKKEWANAVEQMTAALQLTPRDESAHFRLAQLYLFQQKFDPAFSVLENAQKQFPSSA